jgi:hypothetical protein
MPSTADNNCPLCRISVPRTGSSHDPGGDRQKKQDLVNRDGRVQFPSRHYLSENRDGGPSGVLCAQYRQKGAGICNACSLSMIRQDVW